MPHMLVGAIALSFWGRSRATADIDLIVQIKGDFDSLTAIVPAGWQRDRRWLQVNPMIRHIQNRFLVQGIVIDFMLPRDSQEKEAMLRRKRRRLWKRYVAVASAEDLVIMKLKVGRPRDFDDAMSIVTIQNKIDRGYILQWCRRLHLMDEFAFLFSRNKK